MALTMRPILLVLYLGIVFSLGAEIFVSNGFVGGDGSELAPFATIQQAVNNASNGDTITVGPGTYSGSITITGKTNLYIASSDGYVITVLSGATNLMTITSSTGIIVEGFRITGNDHAIKVTGGSVTLVGLAFDGNVAPLYTESYASVTVIGCSFDSNVYHGIQASYTALTVQSSRIRLNTNGAQGAGISAYACNVSIDNTLFIENTGAVNFEVPGAILLPLSLTITNSKFYNNNGGISTGGTLRCSGIYTVTTSGNHFCGQSPTFTCTGFTEYNTIGAADRCGVCFGELENMDCNYGCFAYPPITCAYTPKNIYVSTLNGSSMNDGLTIFTPKLKIQEGIDLAHDQDTVIILPGIYTGAGNTQLNLLGKNITVRSQSGLFEDVTINCSGSGNAFTAESGETAKTIIHGITVRECSAAINITSSTLKLSKMYMRDNTNGAVIVAGSYLIMDQSVVKNTIGESGAITTIKKSTNAFFKISNSKFVNNQAHSGGAISLATRTNGIVTNSNFVGNSATQTGGAITAGLGSRLLITGTTFHNNTATDGGGIYCPTATSNLAIFILTSSVTSCGMGNSFFQCPTITTLNMTSPWDSCGVCDGSNTPDCASRCWGGKTVIGGVCCTQGLLDYLPSAC